MDNSKDAGATLFNYLNLIRIHQWIKNLFVFTPLFFSGQVLDNRKLILTFFAFILFCLLTSCAYIFNDYVDIELDKKHPQKKNRPLASAQISVRNALVLGVILFLSAAAVCFYLNNLKLTMISASYLALNAAYSLKLKQIALIDISSIAFGFILRVEAGGAVISISISHWLYIMTFLLSLFLALAKRRDDLIIEARTGQRLRRSMGGYNLNFISNAISVLLASLIVAYLLYITSPAITERFIGRPMFLSAFFVIVGALRYLQITLVDEESGSPTRILLKDLFIQLLVVMWLLYFMVNIYFS